MTLLASAPSRVENLDAQLCSMYWHLEFHEQDFANFVDLAHGDGVSALRLSLDDRPARSIRYREFMVPQGFEDELRAVLRAGDSIWGFIDFYRESASQPFAAEDVALVKSVTSIIASSLRKHVRATNPWLGQPAAPGLLVIDRHGRAVSSNDEAKAWLRDLWPCSATDCGPVESSTSPTSEPATWRSRRRSRARSQGAGVRRGPRSVRLACGCATRGRWLVLHASSLSGLVNRRRVGGHRHRGGQERRGRADHHRGVLPDAKGVTCWAPSLEAAPRRRSPPSCSSHRTPCGTM